MTEYQRIDLDRVDIAVAIREAWSALARHIAQRLPPGAEIGEEFGRLLDDGWLAVCVEVNGLEFRMMVPPELWRWRPAPKPGVN